MSNGQLRGESYTTGCLGNQGARVWFFIGFLLGFGSLIGASYILFGEYLFPSKYMLACITHGKSQLLGKRGKVGRLGRVQRSFRDFVLELCNKDELDSNTF